MKYKLAINGGEPIRKNDFLKWPIHDKRYFELINEVIESGVWSFDGPKELEFARRFANYHDADFGECVVNGTAAIEIALKSLDIMPGDEIIIPALTWIATASAPIMIGAVPVFVDIDPNTYCISIDGIKNAITDKTKAIIPVHLYCSISNMDEIMNIAICERLRVVEDCAHVVGSKYKGRGVGSIGDAGCFSFQQTKSMTSGEGGIIITNNSDVAEKAYSYKNCGRVRKGDKRVLGHNYRITEFQAAILLAQFDKLDEQIETRQKNMNYLTDRLSTIDGIDVLKKTPGTERQGLYSFVIKVDSDKFGEIPLKRIREALCKEGIPTFDVYNAVYQDPLWTIEDERFHYSKNIRYTKCPVSENAYKNSMLLGHNVFLGDSRNMDDIADAIIKVKKYADELK